MTLFDAIWHTKGENALLIGLVVVFVIFALALFFGGE